MNQDCRYKYKSCSDFCFPVLSRIYCRTSAIKGSSSIVKCNFILKSSDGSSVLISLHLLWYKSSMSLYFSGWTIMKMKKVKCLWRHLPKSRMHWTFKKCHLSLAKTKVAFFFQKLNTALEFFRYSLVFRMSCKAY